MPVLRRPATLDEGVSQLLSAIRDTTPKEDTSPALPRYLLWRACDRLFCENFVQNGMRPLYEKNKIVSLLFNIIVPHLEERLRYATLQEEFDKAQNKPQNVQQNTERLNAILEEVRLADAFSKSRKVDESFAAMRDAMEPLIRGQEVLEGLKVLYISSKTARTALDLILQRLISAFRNDVSIKETYDIPMEALSIVM